MSDEAKQPAPFDEFIVVNGTLVIPGDRYEIRRVTIEEVSRMSFEQNGDGWNVPCHVHYEVTERPGWTPRHLRFAVSSG